MARHQYQQLVSSLNNGNDRTLCLAVSSDARICSYAGIICVTIYCLASLPFSESVAQAIANEQHTDVWYSLRLSGMLALIFIMIQTVATSLPFLVGFQVPLLKRYELEGRNIEARRVWRRMQTHDRGPSTFEVVVVYEPDIHSFSASYGKKMKVTEEEYNRETLNVLVVPGIPTSAILTRRVGELNNQLGMSAVALLPTIAGNMFLVIETNNLMQYSYNSFWTNGGLWIIMAIGWVGSLLLGYVGVANNNTEMLYGKSAPYYPDDVDGDEDDDITSDRVGQQLEMHWNQITYDGVSQGERDCNQITQS